MGARNRRRPKRPWAHALLILAAAMLTVLAVAVVWRLAHLERPAPPQTASAAGRGTL